ncbi:MAG TPA: carboxypeptidase-like regulatory domain-containing protein [Terriglobales bacterium]|nr:carboxypeptidase-like regulatory domain-containing protein [Terriglobales bacterium]
MLQVSRATRLATFLGLALLLILCSSTYLFAQASLGGITGIVRDTSGAVIANAKVTLINDATGDKIETKTTPEGNFSFVQLNPANYTIKVEAPNFRTGVFTQVKVDAGRVYSMTTQLEVGAASESVEVVAGTEIVNTVTTDVSNTVQAQQMADLPLLGRNPLNLIALQAGVVGNARTATTINGGRPAWTNTTQDGVSINDNYIRTNAVDFVPNRPSADQVAEFTVTTNNQSAESFGGASQVKLTTKSGTNDFHGGAYYFNRNSDLAANSWTNNLAGNKKGFLNRNQFGANGGGAVIKNRLFYYGYYEGLRQRSAATSGSGSGNVVPKNPISSPASIGTWMLQACSAALTC